MRLSPPAHMHPAGSVAVLLNLDSTPVQTGHHTGRGVPTDTSVDFDAEALQFAVQRRTGDTEGCCGLHTVLAGLAQCQDDRVSLD